MSEADNTILIIDDEPEILLSLNRLLRKDFRVLTANNAEEGVRLLNSSAVQVIISDQRMPGITGVDFFEKVKSDFPDAVRLIRTGYADIEAVIDSINRGNIFRYITKPWNAEELKGIINEAFERYRSARERAELLKQLSDAKLLLERQVEKRTDELNEKNKMLNQFLGMAAHDLRSPVSIISGYSDMILSEMYDDSPARSLLEIINSQSSFMLSIIDDLLDIATIEAGKLVLNKRRLDYKDFLRRNIMLNSHFAGKKNIRIEENIPSGDLSLVFDPDKITQVLNNLIGNAVKYSSGGSLIRVSAYICDGRVCTDVADEGIGIPEDELNRLFKAFSKTSVKAPGGEKSTGLGLLIAKKNVEGHGGAISVKSVSGRGSTFTFSIPV